MKLVVNLQTKLIFLIKLAILENLIKLVAVLFKSIHLLFRLICHPLSEINNLIAILGGKYDFRRLN